MRKTLQDMARYLQEIMVPETHEAYAVKPIFRTVAEEGVIREGVLAFRAFLVRLYDVLIAQGEVYDKHKKAAHAFENRTSISVYYPFLHHVKTMLLKIGYRGVGSENAQSFTCGNDVFNEKLSVSKNLEVVRFLVDCGMCFGGIDLNDKKQKLSDIQTLHVSYPDNPDLFVGLKVMAIAEVELGTLANQDIFLRCDYRVLKEEETDAASILKDSIKPLSAEVQSFLLQLHQRYLEKGLQCVVEIKGFWIYIKYSYKRKDVWGFNASLNNGYQINVKALHTHEYADIIETFPLFLQEMIGRGYGCGKKRGTSGHCDGGCRGLRISLDDSVLAIRDDIVTWFDQELSCLQRK